jgi:hypothetical protein
MARFSSLARARPPYGGQPGSTRVRCLFWFWFVVFGDLAQTTFQELNNYSGQMARCNMAIQLGNYA